jgi:hypothetical protein
MNLKPILVQAVVLVSMLFVRPSGAEQSRDPADTVTTDEVLAMMARVPERELAPSDHEPPPGHYDRIADAHEIAVAIAAAVNGTDPLYQSRALTASLFAVHSAWESGNRRCARGDSGRSWGFLQLSIAHTDRYQACDPALAARKWLRLAKSVWCPNNPEGTELAAVESGRCDAAWVKSRHRLAVAKQIVDDVAHASLQRE